MCLNGTYPFWSETLVRQLPYYLFRETCFMDSYPWGKPFSSRVFRALGGGLFVELFGQNNHAD